MENKELNERQLNHKGESLFNNIPKCENIITVVYAGYDDIFLFNAYGLSDKGKSDLVETLISTIQSGTAVKREIVSVIGNTYFVY